ncbi:MAG: hypothetical protein KJ025_04175 [Burkholderiales bacterium]|nr:hypothetical protein [Burkholderiales bacterium]
MSTRDLFVKNAKEQLDEWNEELARIEIRLHLGKVAMRDELEKRTAELRRLRATAIKELRDIERSGESAWEDRKVGAEQALSAMQGSLASVRSQFG